MRAAAILHVPRSPHSSVVIGYDKLARAMRERGHSLEILTPEDLRSRGFSPRLAPLVLPLLVRRWVRARTDLDLVLFHSYTGWLTGRRRGLRQVVAFHGFEPLFHEALAAETRRRGRRLSARYAAMYGVLMPRMLRRACRRADLVLCLNTREREAIVEGGYAPADRVELTWHDAGDEFFRRHEYRDRATTLLAVMQWLPTKGTAYLVDAFTPLARKDADLRLSVAGTLVEPDAVRAQFPEDVRGRVEVHASFNEQEHRALLRRADVFVHPSLSEGFSRAVIEAMAAGLPIVTTRTGFAIDRLADGVDARVVPIADAAALASAIERLLADGHERRRLGEAAQAHAARLREADATETLAVALERLVARSA